MRPTSTQARFCTKNDVHSALKPMDFVLKMADVDTGELSVRVKVCRDLCDTIAPGAFRFY